jgi:hypothetical protein
MGRMQTIMRRCGLCRQTGHTRTKCTAPAPPPLPKKSRGGSSLKSGSQYEKSTYTFLQTVPHITCRNSTASAGHGVDIQFTYREQTVGIELKNKGGFEAGGRVMRLHDDKLCLDSKPETVLFQSLLGDYVPFSGRIPSFLRGDKTFPTWLEEAHLFRDETLVIRDESTTASYYANKGCSYIQIENYGLYHTGIDVLELGVPFFVCKAKLRIRCKRHGSNSMPSSVQASIVYDKKSITKSPFLLTTHPFFLASK